jgi:hypothetical protein
MSDLQRQLDGVYPQGQLGPYFNPGSAFKSGNPFNAAPQLMGPMPATANTVYNAPFAIPQPSPVQSSMMGNTIQVPVLLPAVSPRGQNPFMYPARDFVGYN